MSPVSPVGVGAVHGTCLGRVRYLLYNDDVNGARNQQLTGEVRSLAYNDYPNPVAARAVLTRWAAGLLVNNKKFYNKLERVMADIEGEDNSSRREFVQQLSFGAGAAGLGFFSDNKQGSEELTFLKDDICASPSNGEPKGYVVSDAANPEPEIQAAVDHVKESGGGQVLLANSVVEGGYAVGGPDGVRHDTSVRMLRTGNMRAGADVKSYGAAGDGSKNDQPAIQAAVDYVASVGGEVFLPQGVYGVASSIVNTASNVILRGESLWYNNRGTKIQALSSEADPIVHWDGSGSRLIGGGVERILIDANRQSIRTPLHVYGLDKESAFIRDVTTAGGTREGIRLEECWTTQIENVKAGNATPIGLNCLNCNNLTMEKIYVLHIDPEGTGIRMTSAEGNTLRGFIVEHCGVGVEMVGSGTDIGGNSLIGGYFEDGKNGSSMDPAILIGTAPNNPVSGFTVDSVFAAISGSAVRADHADGGKIQSVTGSPIKVTSNAKNIRTENCHLVSKTGDGLVADLDAPSVYVTPNEFASGTNNPSIAQIGSGGGTLDTWALDSVTQQDIAAAVKIPREWGGGIIELEILFSSPSTEGENAVIYGGITRIEDGSNVTKSIDTKTEAIPDNKTANGLVTYRSSNWQVNARPTEMTKFTVGRKPGNDSDTLSGTIHIIGARLHRIAA